MLGGSKRDIRKTDGNSFIISINKSSVLANPRPIQQNYTEERRAVETSKPRSDDDKLSTLKAYRRAKGLCFKCGAKWGPQHVCSSSVPLHVVEELWQMISDTGQLTNEPNSVGNLDSG